MKNEGLSNNISVKNVIRSLGKCTKGGSITVINHGQLRNSALAIVTVAGSLGCDWAPRPRVRKLPRVKQEIVSRKQEKVPILNKKRARTKVCLD